MPASVTSLLILVVAAAAAARPAGSEVEVGERFELGVGESVAVDAGRLTLRFERVSEDTRCPRDVDCVWAGDAVVVLGAATDSDSRELELHLASDAAFAGYSVELASLAPAPETGRRIDPRSYEATLVVTLD